MNEYPAEIAVLKILINYNEAIQDLNVSEKHFQNRNYALIFESIRYLISNKEPADIITVAERLMDQTGKDYLPILSDIGMSDMGSRINAKAYGKLMETEYLVRETKGIASELLSSKCDPESISKTIRDLMELGRVDDNYEYSLNEAMKIGITSIDQACKNKGKLIGISTGLDDLNEVLGGYHNGDLIIYGARPAMGKTSVLLNQLMGANEMVGCISGEQGIEQISHRLISVQSKVALMSMRNGKMGEDDWPKLETGALNIKRHPGIRFFDKSSPTIEEIESNARRWKFEYDIKALYVDYLQKIKRDMRKNKSEAIGDNASRLKDLARELNIPIVCLAQVKRDVETRANKRPLMADISDTSEAEKEADQMIMIYRDEVYNSDTEYPGVMELIIEKNRHGATGVVNAAWDGRYLSVTDMQNSNKYD